MKHILITGATSGLGLAAAQHFAAQPDHKVVITGTRPDGGTIAKNIGPNVIFKQVDVTDETATKKLFAELPALDVLVNSAGIYTGNNNDGISNVSTADFEHEWRVNTLGVFLACKYAMPLLQKSKGNIVTISSISGMQPDATEIGYGASKAAVNMLTKSLALAHVKDGVRVNAVCPGPIETPMLYKGFDGKLTGNPDYDEWMTNIPMGRSGQPKDVVKAVAYLADADNDYVTGTLLVVDGGWMSMSL